MMSGNLLSPFKNLLTVDNCPEVLHVLDILSRWALSRADLGQDLLTKAFPNFWVSAKEVDGEGEGGSGLADTACQ